MSKKDQTLPNAAAITAWTRLVRAQVLVFNEVQEELKLAGLPALSWYDVLYELHKAGSKGLRQYEIAERTLMTKYNLSRLLKRLLQESLIEIIACLEDGRGNLVTINTKGTELLRKMWPVYGTVLHRNMQGSLSVAELKALSQLLSKISR